MRRRPPTGGRGYGARIRPWPPITEPELLERLALSDEAFRDLMRAFAGALGHRPYEPAHLERALAYPWERPARSYVLRDGDVELLHDLAPAEQHAGIERFTAQRHPIVAIGSNAAPEWLHAKFAHFPDPEDRTALILAGTLHDVDVGPAATISAYGSMPATLFASPGTDCRAAVLWLTGAQVTQLTWSEISYRLGRLETARFTADEEHVEVTSLFAYINRFGTFAPDGEPVALAAIPASGRTAPARTQAELLTTAAEMLGMAPPAPEAVVRAVFEDMAGLVARVQTTVWPAARLLEPEHWTPYPAAPAP